MPGGFPPYILRTGSGRTDGRCIRCCKMCSVDSRLWCWDTTTQAASDDAPSQRRGCRGVLSFAFEVRVHQGRVTLPCKSLREVRAPNTLLPGSRYSHSLSGPADHIATILNLFLTLADVLDSSWFPKIIVILLIINSCYPNTLYYCIYYDTM